MNDLAVVVLAAGEGKRFNNGRPSTKPKVLFKIAGNPIISYPLKTIKKLEPTQIIIIVGHKADVVKKALGSGYEYVFQDKALGTADATKCAIPILKPQIKNFLVLNGDDSAFYSLSTLKAVILKHKKEKNVLTFVTLLKKNPFGLGRIVRLKGGRLLKIVEEKNANDEEKKIHEVNDGCYLFEKNWFIKNISKVNQLKVGEYYLTDMAEIALFQDEHVGTFKLVNESEWASVNSFKELKYADQLMRKGVERQKTKKFLDAKV